MKPYEVIDHAADIGLRIHGADLQALFLNAALGFFDLALENPPAPESGDEKPSRVFRLKAGNVEELFWAWLNELLFVFSAKHLVPCRFQFLKLTETELEAEAFGASFDPTRHEPKMEIKAVTYHQFHVRKVADGWQAQVIFDI